MNVLFISPTGTLDNGAEKSVLQLMKHLSSNGIRVFNLFPENNHTTHQKYVEFLEKHAIVGIPITTYQWWWEEFSASDKKDSDLLTVAYQKAVFEIRNVIQKEKIELVVSNTVNVFQGAIAAACENVAHMYLIHEFPFGEFAYYKDKIGFIDSFSDKVFAVQGKLYGELQKYFLEDKLGHFIPFTEIDNRELPEGEGHRIVSIGKLSERKNQLELIKAYHQLGRFDVPLVFIGGWDESYKRICEQYIEQQGLETIHFLGYQSNPWQDITNQDICVLPSSLETFHLVAIESLLNGVPLIMSNNLGHLSVQEIFGSGHIYSLGDIDELTSKLADSLEQFTLYQTTAQNAQEKARLLYSIDVAYREVMEAILSCKSMKTRKIEYPRLFEYSAVHFDLILNRQRDISIYFKNETNDFNEENRCYYPLLPQGELDISVGESTQIRIDLTELPSIYSTVVLTDSQTGKELEVIATNGMKHENGFVFLDRDPYLIYDVQDYKGRTLRLFYVVESVSTSPFDSHHPVFLHSLVERIRKMEYMEQEYQALQENYSKIVHSRRWTIPTKIINFFRRKS